MGMNGAGPGAFPGAKDYHRRAAPALPRNDPDSRGFIGPAPPGIDRMVWCGSAYRRKATPDRKSPRIP